MYTSRQASQEAFLPLMLELVLAYQAFFNFSAAHIRSFDLTVPQFDVVATLGNTQGMNFKELGEKTLITKGTLTGVVDRLEAKNLVKRVLGNPDRRTAMVVLTEAGDAFFQKCFPEHILHLKQQFDQLNPIERQQIILALQRLKGLFPNASIE